jgi:hypothetical protein
VHTYWLPELCSLPCTPSCESNARSDLGGDLCSPADTRCQKCLVSAPLALYCALRRATALRSNRGSLYVVQQRPDQTRDDTASSLVDAPPEGVSHLSLWVKLLSVSGSSKPSVTVEELRPVSPHIHSCMNSRMEQQSPVIQPPATAHPLSSVVCPVCCVSSCSRYQL